MHKEARTAWQSLVWASHAAQSASPSQIKLLQGLKSPFQHCLFPAASVPGAKMGWGEGVRYCNLFPPAMTVYTWLLSNSRGYSEARVWPERGAEHLLLWGALKSMCTTWSSWLGSGKAEHPGRARPLCRASLVRLTSPAFAPFFP